MSKHLQHFLFKSALQEHGIESKFTYNHQLGFQQIGNLKCGIKFPQSYVQEISKLSQDKIHDYCFIGYMDKRGRKDLLAPFQNNNSFIKESAYGRDPVTKYNFKSDYYQHLANSWFVLCPIHIGSWYKHTEAWTYRFVEALLCKSIPVVFRDTPLGDSFIQDIHFLWNDEQHTQDNYEQIVEDNYQKAIRYWTLQPEELELVK